jgi:hypothetical protein
MIEYNSNEPLERNLARAAKDLATGMMARVQRTPDVADFEVVFKKIFDQVFRGGGK